MGRQFDIWVAGGKQPYGAQTIFEQMVSPPAAGAAADASPTEINKENPGPPTGYNNPTGNPPDQHSSSWMTSTPPTNQYNKSAGS
jgi:hypothetical protein